VTVAYEKAHGRRVLGQAADAGFQVVKLLDRLRLTRRPASAATASTLQIALSPTKSGKTP